jgi:hypothetical protein
VLLKPVTSQGQSDLSLTLTTNIILLPKYRMCELHFHHHGANLGTHANLRYQETALLTDSVIKNREYYTIDTEFSQWTCLQTSTNQFTFLNTTHPTFITYPTASILTKLRIVHFRVSQCSRPLPAPTLNCHKRVIKVSL